MSQYSVYVLPGEFQTIQRLPGQVRQRVKRAIDGLFPRADGNPTDSVAIPRIFWASMIQCAGSCGGFQ